jgi:phosphocarrier protein FPr/phosphocarrier protein
MRIVVLPDALHARPADLLVRAATQLACRVEIQKGERRANARDILEVLGLRAAKGEEIVLIAEGEGAEAALESLVELIARDFDPDLVPAHGVVAAAGIAIGEAVVLEPSDPAPAGAGSITPEEERARARSAFARAETEVAAIVAALPGHEAQLFEPELAILRALETPVLGRIAAGQSAEEAVVAEATRGPSDLIDDARQRLLDALSGTTGAHAARLAALAGREAVVVVHEITPSFVAALPANVLGVIAALDEGDDPQAPSPHASGTTSHAAILARGRGLPLAFVPAHVAWTIDDGAQIVLDTTVSPARIWHSPGAELVDGARRRRQALHTTESDLPAHTRPSLPSGVALRVNIGSTREPIPARAEGVGLLRTELLFADRRTAPREEEQAAAYASIAARVQGPVVVRIFDAGGDKPLPFLHDDAGLRGIALLRAHPSVLATQIRAIRRARGSRSPALDLRVLIPLASSVEDLAEVRALAGPDLPVGAMIETPRAVDAVDALAAAADFVCIGTNDLAAEALGVGRGAPVDPLDRRVLDLVRRTVEGAHRAGRTVTVCGEIAAEPASAAILIGLGVDALSVAPPRLSSLADALGHLTIDDARAAAEAALAAPSGAEP